MASSISLQVSEIGQKQNCGHARKVEDNVIDWLEPHLSTVVIALPEVNISARPKHLSLVFVLPPKMKTFLIVPSFLL